MLSRYSWMWRTGSVAVSLLTEGRLEVRGLPWLLCTLGCPQCRHSPLKLLPSARLTGMVVVWPLVLLGAGTYCAHPQLTGGSWPLVCKDSGRWAWAKFMPSQPVCYLLMSPRCVDTPPDVMNRGSLSIEGKGELSVSMWRLCLRQWVAVPGSGWQSNGSFSRGGARGPCGCLVCFMAACSSPRCSLWSLNFHVELSCFTSQIMKSLSWDCGSHIFPLSLTEPGRHTALGGPCKHAGLGRSTARWRGPCEGPETPIELHGGGIFWPVEDARR